jgi:hypothetical protein
MTDAHLYFFSEVVKSLVNQAAEKRKFTENAFVALF